VTVAYAGIIRIRFCSKSIGYYLSRLLAPRGGSKVKKESISGIGGLIRPRFKRGFVEWSAAGGIEEHSPQGLAGLQRAPKRATLGAPFWPQLHRLSPRTMPESPHPPQK